MHRNSTAGANAVVVKDVPENAVVGGVPAKIIKMKKLEVEEYRVVKIVSGIVNRCELIFNRINYFFLNMDDAPNVMDTLTTLRKIESERMSFCRFGDGEFYLLWGMDIPFQAYSDELREDLEKVLNDEMPNVLVGIPDIFKGLGGLRKQAIAFNQWFLGKYYNKIVETLPKNNLVYGNTAATRFQSGYTDRKNAAEAIKYYKQIWKNRHIVCIEGSKTRMGVGNDLFAEAASFRRILAPAKNAYSRKEQVLGWIQDNAESFHKDTLFIIALGPTATVLAYELAKMDFQALDLGHLDIQYEYYLREAEEKIAIEGKYVNEAKDGREVTDSIVDDAYLNSIIADFSAAK